MTKQALSSYSIDSWLFSPRQNTLTCDDQVITLTPLQSGIVTQLIAAHPEVVSANELLDALTDDAQGNRNKLYQSIAKLRRVFDDSSHKAQFIETVARKGYRLLPTPQEITDDIEQSNNDAEIANDDIDDFEIHSGALEQNIFEDLGFIEQSTQEDSSIEQEQIPQLSDTAVADAPVGSDKPDHSDELPKQGQSDTQPQRKPIALWGSIVAIIIACVVYFGFNEEQQDSVYHVPEQLFILPLAASDIADKSEHFSANINQWFEHKIQHLPLVKVRKTQQHEKYPLILPTLAVNELQQTVLTLEYWHDDKRHNDIVWIIPDEINEQTAQQAQVFNQQIVTMVLNSGEAILSDDVCTNADFNQPLISDNQRCLLVLMEQGQEFLAQSLPQPDELGTLSGQVKKAFPNDSLGFYFAAQHDARQGLVGQAIDNGMLAIEKNANNPDYILFLSALHRRQSQFHKSLQLTELLVNLEPANKMYRYWQSYDLMALGFRQRANELLKQYDVPLNNISDEIHFKPLNYNKIKQWLAQEQGLSKQERALIKRKLQNDSFADLTPTNRFKKALATAVTPMTPRIDNNWRLGAKHLVNEDIDDGLSAINDDDDTSGFISTFSLGRDDRVFYLPTYANLLLQSGEQKSAETVLKRLILLAQSDPHSTDWTLTLAEAYAINGDKTRALAQLAKLLATGWLPHPDRQLWTLSNNPNFASLKQQWEFINLLELIDNRRKLMLVLIEEKNEKTDATSP